MGVRGQAARRRSALAPELAEEVRRRAGDGGGHGRPSRVAAGSLSGHVGGPPAAHHSDAFLGVGAVNC